MNYTIPQPDSGKLAFLGRDPRPHQCRLCHRPCQRGGHPLGCGLPPVMQVLEPFHPCACGTSTLLHGEVFGGCCARIHVAHFRYDSERPGDWTAHRTKIAFCSCGEYEEEAPYDDGYYGDDGGIRYAQDRHVNALNPPTMLRIEEHPGTGWRTEWWSDGSVRSIPPVGAAR